MIGRAIAHVPLLSESTGLAHVGQATRITRTVTHKKTGEVKTGSRIFLSSLPWEAGRHASFAIGNLVRLHWVVENNIHWLRDGVWKEDTSRSPNAACALALLRTALLAPIRAGGHTSLTTALESFAENKASAVNLICNKRPA